MIEIRGTLAEVESETLALLNAQRDAIRDGRLRGTPWLQALLEEAGDIIRRRRSAEARRAA